MLSSINSSRYASSLPRPNRPPKPPKSRRKNLPRFFKFSFRLPLGVLSDGECAWLACWAEEAGAGDDAPESRPTLMPEVAPPVIPATPDERLGFPKRSTPSLAAEMMAEPSMEASKRVDMEPALPRPRP